MPSNFRLALHRAARHPTSAPGSTASALPSCTSARFQGHRAAATGKPRRCSRCMTRRSASCAGARVPMPEGKLDFHRRHAHHDDGGRRQHADRHGGAPLSRRRSRWSTIISTTPTASLLIVPQIGACASSPSSAASSAAPGEICVIPRGVKFQGRARRTARARGYVCENYGAKFTLPDRGPIGANCLANPRDFKTPVAAFEDKETPCRLTVKWCGGFHRLRDRPFAARRRRLAWQLRALQI